MTDNRKKFNINVIDDEDEQTSSLKSGNVLFKKNINPSTSNNASSSCEGDVGGISHVTLPSPSNSAPGLSDNANNRFSSQENQGCLTNQNSKQSQSSQEKNKFGNSSFLSNPNYTFLKNPDLYKLPPKPVPEVHQPVPKNTNSIIVNGRQRGNPILKHVKNVPFEYGDIIPDYQIGERHCVLFLSLRYHNLNPEYIHERLKSLGNRYDLRVILVQVDVHNCKRNLKELGKICLLAGCTLILTWSAEEAGRYLETYKQYENKPPDILQERVETDHFAKIQDILTTVKSINKTDAATLLSNFGSLKNIVNATQEEIEVCPGFGQLKAQRLYKVFNESFKRTTINESPVKESLPGPSKGRQSTPTSKLKRPGEHSYLQECLLQGKEDSPPIKKKKFLSENGSSSEATKLPVTNESTSHDKISIESLLKNIPRISENIEDNLKSKHSPIDENEIICLDEDEDEDEPNLDLADSAKKKKCPSIKPNAIKPSSNISKSDAIYKSGLSTSRSHKGGYRPSYEKESMEEDEPNLDSAENNASKKSPSIKPNALKPSSNISKSDAIYKSGLSTSRSRNEGYRPSYEKETISVESVDLTLSEDLKKYPSSKSKSANVIKKATVDNNVIKTSIVHKKKTIDNIIAKNIDSSTENIDVRTQRKSSESDQIISNIKQNIPLSTKPGSSNVTTENTLVEKRIARNIDPKTGKARVGTHAARRRSESDKTADVSKQSYSQQITNDEFNDLLADDDDDDDDDI